MKKLIDYLMIFTALILLGVGCQSEEIPPVGEDERNVSEDSDEMRTFSLIASMPEESRSTSSIPDESGSTRIAFFQVGKSVALIWEEGDQLDLLFVQGTTQVKQTVTVSNIYAEGKKAAFEFTLPAAIQAGYFDLYGVYGGGGLSDSNPSLAVLPLINGSAPSLTSLAAGKKFMMVFSKNRLTTTSPQASVTFRHVGSLFCLTLKNARGTALENLGSIRLGSSFSRWAYNNSATEPHYYNLVDDAFRNPESAGSFITLYGDGYGGVATNDTLNFWGWYPTLPDVNWPVLFLALYDKDNNLLKLGGNILPARTSPTLPGKSYRFYAVWNDAGLYVADHTYTRKDLSAPILSTTAINNITQTTAMSGGNITYDGGATVTARGVCWSKSQNPTISDSKTINGTGPGSFTSSIFGLEHNTTYYVRAYATNSEGTGYGNELSFTTGVPDASGNVYTTVIIGNQEWFAENLKTTHYNDGTPIPQTANASTWVSLTRGSYAWYNNDFSTYRNTYGALYNWYAVETGKLCPTGWHVPSNVELTTLIKYAGGEGVAGGKLKSTRTAPDAHPRWNSPNTAATDAYGFSALPGGFRYGFSGGFSSVGHFGYWWTSTEADATTAWYRNMTSDNGTVLFSTFGDKTNGYSVRCLRD